MRGRDGRYLRSPRARPHGRVLLIDGGDYEHERAHRPERPRLRARRCELPGLRVALLRFSGVARCWRGIDVLSAVLELRECGRIDRVAAEFADFDRLVESAAQDDANLAILVGTDLPTGEHPYAEVAAQLQLRGTDRTAEWVLARLGEWIADGTIIRVAALPA